MKTLQIVSFLSLISVVFPAATYDKKETHGAAFTTTGKRRVILSYPELVSILSELSYKTHLSESKGASHNAPRDTRDSINPSSMQEPVEELRKKGFEFDDLGNNSVAVTIPEGVQIPDSQEQDNVTKSSCSSLLEFFTGDHDSYDELRDKKGVKATVTAAITVAGSAISAVVGCAGSLITGFVSLVGNLLTGQHDFVKPDIANHSISTENETKSRKISLSDIGPKEVILDIHHPTEATTNGPNIPTLSPQQVANKKFALEELASLNFTLDEIDGNIHVTLEADDEENADAAEFQDALNRLKNVGYLVEEVEETDEAEEEQTGDADKVKKLVARKYSHNEAIKSSIDTQRSVKIMRKRKGNADLQEQLKLVVRHSAKAPASAVKVTSEVKVENVKQIDDVAPTF